VNQSWVAIQRNPRSGSGGRRRQLVELIRELKRRGLKPRLFKSRERLTALLESPDLRQSLRCIVAAGGDGTVCDVINRFPDLPVCPFPLGTENLLSRHYGIPCEALPVADVIEHGQCETIDVGMLGERRFLLMASVGFDALVIRRLHESRRGNISHLNYVWPILFSALSYRFPLVRVFVDDATEPVTGSLVVVANYSEYAFGLPLVPEADPQDGLFSVRVFPDPGVLSLLGYCRLLRGHQHVRRPEIPFLTGRKVRIESDTPAPVQVDGDPCGVTPCTITLAAGQGRLLTMAR
jgi:diacylglycerol kinase family enzyme